MSALLVSLCWWNFIALCPVPAVFLFIPESSAQNGPVGHTFLVPQTLLRRKNS